MEQVLEGIGTVLHAMLAGIFALTPGMAFWLVVLSIYMAIRWVGRRGPFQRLGRGDQAA